MKKKREEILNTTLDLVCEIGFHDTSIPLIIKKSGVASGTIYHHFKNKEEVLRYSTIIQDGLTKLFNTYLAGLTTKEQAKLYFKARKLYAKNKLSNSTSAKVSGQQSIVSMSFDKTTSGMILT